MVFHLKKDFFGLILINITVVEHVFVKTEYIFSLLSEVGLSIFDRSSFGFFLDTVDLESDFEAVSLAGERLRQLFDCTDFDSKFRFKLLTA